MEIGWLEWWELMNKGDEMMDEITKITKEERIKGKKGYKN